MRELEEFEMLDVNGAGCRQRRGCDDTSNDNGYRRGCRISTYSKGKGGKGGKGGGKKGGSNYGFATSGKGGKGGGKGGKRRYC